MPSASSTIPTLARRPWRSEATATLVAPVLVAVFGLSAVGCGLLSSGDEEPSSEIESSTGSTSGTGSEESIDTGEASARPVERPLVEIDVSFDAQACNEAIPAAYQARCGTVDVPMDWETGEGTVSLAVAVFTAQTDPSSDDGGEADSETSTGAGDETGDDDPVDDLAPADSTPVIYLEGGPGGHALEALQFTAPDLLDPLLPTRDVVVFDQRGAGLSTPRLGCDEVTTVTRDLEDIPVVSDEVADERFHQALTECRNRLAADGVDLSSFNSRFSAQDVEAIRQALGYDQVSLLGVSYGTKLGLEVLRQNPGTVRSVVLDSVFPPEVDSVGENPQTFVDAYQQMVDACAAEAGCRAGGDLAERLTTLATRLQVDPVVVTVEDWIGGTTDEVYLTGDVLVGVVTQALYSPQSFSDIPELVDDLEQGQLDVVEEYLSQQRTTERFFTDGMFYAITCRDEVGFADPATVVDPPDPFGLRSEFNLASNVGSNAFATCNAFDNGLAPASANQAVQSDVPTLLLAGGFDPVTPVQWAAEAEEDLSNSLLVVAPHDSHGVSSSRCGMSMITAFFADPEGSLGGGERALDTDCVSIRDWGFVDAPAATVETVDATYLSQGLEITTTRPEDWAVGVLEGDQYRRSSFLDPTQLHQLAGDERLGQALEQFIQDSHDVQLGPAQSLSDTSVPVDSDAVDDSWNVRSASGSGVVVDWFERPVGQVLIYVILVSAPSEREGLIESVLTPALSSIEVGQAG